MISMSRLLVRPTWLTARYSSSAMKVVKLTNRSVIRLNGAEDETRNFVQGLITNDIHHLSGPSDSLYCMFLNKQGRVLYDTVIYAGQTKGELFVEGDSTVIADLRKHMMIYRIRRKISIDIVDDEYAVWSALGDTKIPGAMGDPRVKDLGTRILTRSLTDTIPGDFTVDSLRNYNHRRYELGVAEGIKEIVPGKAFPLEYNCDYMHGLSVHKGCYLGQEFTARTYHTGVVRKRIMPFELLSVADSEDDLVDKEVFTAEEKQGGKVKAVEKSSGIGLLRTELVLATSSLSINKTLPVKTWRPNWWPVAPKSCSS